MVVYTKQQIIKKQVDEFRKLQRNFILTSRFNNETWNENQKYISKKQNIKCIYCCPERVSQIVPDDAVLFILEMNNDTNKIMGIGMVKNHPKIQTYNVYSNGNYNRFSYTGKHRIDRKDMNEEEEKIMIVFDVLCFTGNKHMKRGQGLKLFPFEMLYRMSFHYNLVEFITEMFKKRMKNE
jgi:hypothetical protein